MPTRKNAQRLLLASIAFSSLAALAGCGLLVVGGTAATTAVVATDRRTAGEQVEDQAIEMKVGSEMRRLFEDKARVNATSYGGWVLLTGDVPTAQDKQKAEEAARGVAKVVKVVNELRVGDITPVSVRTNDTWLSSKVKTTLINTKEVPSRTIVITTERGVVYLMGRVTNEEGERAAKATAQLNGINKVVKLFQIVTPESIAQPSKPAPVEDASPSSATTSPDAPSSGVQALPVK
ncbi:BON domain-containing protein [Pollutimonas sp. H1-120]|uniref:BON domain-containing protein n=1 Tax=Pollutimonas sp. H1-120 TaxID=3148824 RepID=UPI003B515D65